jgi:hypothetical protein
MSQSHATEQAHAGTSPFTQPEIDALHKDDGKTATIIVCLLTGIFSVGLCLYIGVCYWIIKGL